VLRGDELNALLERIPDIVWRIRLVPDRAFEYVSPSVFALTGYTPAEHYADPDLGRRIVHPDDAAVLEALLQGDEDVPAVTLRWRHRDGQELVTHQRVTFVRDANGDAEAIEGVGRPVTDGPRREHRVRAGDLVLDLVGHRALVGERVVELTPAEHRILALLAASDGPVPVGNLVETLRGTDQPGGARAIQVHVSKLRRKIEDDPRQPKRLITRWGIGYALAR
jgi:PAS domain S-box-containing protein